MLNPRELDKLVRLWEKNLLTDDDVARHLTTNGHTLHDFLDTLNARLAEERGEMHQQEHEQDAPKNTPDMEACAQCGKPIRRVYQDDGDSFFWAHMNMSALSNNHEAAPVRPLTDMDLEALWHTGESPAEGSKDGLAGGEVLSRVHEAWDNVEGAYEPPEYKARPYPLAGKYLPFQEQYLKRAIDYTEEDMDIAA